MKKTNLIFSITSLVTTILLLIMISFGWYATNKEANVNGGNAATASPAIWDVDLKRYKATKVTDTAFSMSDTEVTSLSDITGFDSIASYDRIIYVISYKTSKDTINLSIENIGSRNEDFSIKDSTNKIYTNYLSNVANFYYLASEPVLSKVYTVNGDSYSIDYCEGNDSSIHKVTNIATNNETVDTTATHYFYLLMDYSIVNINKLYTKNLGTDANLLEYNEDVRFILS